MDEPPQNAPKTTPRSLLACSDAAVLDAGRDQLEAAGFRVVSPTGWSDALELYSALRPSLVIVDSGFLHGSGLRLCAALQRAAPEGSGAPLLVLCKREELSGALRAHATDVVRRPIDWRLATHRAVRLADAFALRRELEEARARFLDTERQLADTLADRHRQSLVDPVTELPTVPYLEQLLEQVPSPQAPLSSVALLLVDIDRFSEINQTLGRRTGTEVLKQVASRLTEVLRTVAPAAAAGPALRAAVRVDGDEFALFLRQGGMDQQALEQVARATLREIAMPMRVGETELYLSASIGIAFATGGGRTERLTQQAEIALQETKRRGGRGYRLYSEALGGGVERKLDLDRMLRQALELGQFALHYQPILAMVGGGIVGAEALIRWRHPDLGAISPAEFIPVAEDTGLMPAIGDWVLLEATRQLREWDLQGLCLRMAVNVSHSQIEEGDLVEKVQRAIAVNSLAPGRLELELSERGVLRNEPGIVKQLKALKGLGVRLSADDFGTGDSAIAYLRNFPLDCLKIDRSFVSAIVEHEDDAALTAAIIAMAKQLRLSVVAEGVETEEQLEKLRGFGCEELQGFLFSPALPPEKFALLLAGQAKNRPS